MTINETEVVFSWYTTYMRLPNKFICLTLIISQSLLWPVAVSAQAESSNFKLEYINFGGGGTEKSGSDNYSMTNIVGQTGAQNAGSANYGINQGLLEVLMAAVPPAPTFTNPNNYYNKLKLIINPSDNPTDAKFAIAISADNFASDTRYVQSDNTVGAVLAAEDWQTYASWGGASGFNIVGLIPGTTYAVKSAATRGEFTQSGYGPTAQATTGNPELSFDIDVSSTDTETAGPYTVDIGELAAATVLTASNKVWVDIATNSAAGGVVYIYGTNNGLLSANSNYNITSASANLAGVSEGYGAKSASVAQSGGGPLRAVAPYDGTSDVVGVLDTTKRIMFDTTDQPVTAGRASFQLKAKASATAKAATDYADTLTIVISGTF